MADTTKLIIGVGFLSYYNLLVNIQRHRVLDQLAGLSVDIPKPQSYDHEPLAVKLLT